MDWAFDYMQRDGAEDGEQRWHRDEKGGSVYLRLSTRPLDQLAAADDARAARRTSSTAATGCAGPSPARELAIVYTGAVAPEAIEAAGLLAEDRRGVGVLAVTSADRLSAGWHAAQRAREQGDREARAHVEELLAALPRDAGIVTVMRRAPRGAVLARRRVRPSRARAGRRALRPVGLALRALRPLRPRRERHPGGGRGHQRPPGAVSVLAEVSSAVSRSSIRHARQAQRRAGIHLQPAAVCGLKRDSRWSRLRE